MKTNLFLAAFALLFTISTTTQAQPTPGGTEGPSGRGLEGRRPEDRRPEPRRAEERRPWDQQPADAGQNARRSRQADRPAEQSTLQTITFDVVIADVRKKGKESPIATIAPEKALAAIKELEDRGEIESIVRSRLATVDSQPAMVHLGERVMVTTGRAGGFGDRQGAMSYTAENIGTKIGLTARVESDGSVLAQVDVERSRLATEPKREGEEPAPRPRTLTIMSQSTVRLRNGAPVVLSGAQAGMGDDSLETVIVVTAAVSGEPLRSNRSAAVEAPSAQPATKVFSLRHARATDVARVIGAVFPQRPHGIGVDERTNSLIVSDREENLATVEALVRRLDGADEGVAERK